MKNLLKIVLLSAAFFLVACSNDDKPVTPPVDTGSLTRPAESQLRQELGADENVANFTFSSTNAWTATVTGTGGKSAEPHWLTLDRYEGPSGTYTILVMMDDNISGEEREAGISVTANDGDKFTVNLTQKKTNKDDTTPVVPGLPEAGWKLIHSIERNANDGKGVTTYVFSYDADNRVNGIQVTLIAVDGLHWNKREEDVAISYTATGLTMVRKVTNEYVYGSEEPSSDEYTETYNVTINTRGYATRVSSSGGFASSLVSTLTYDRDGYLKKISYSENKGEGNAEKWESNYTWDGVNQTKIGHGDEDGSFGFSTSTYYDRSNKTTNLDLNRLIQLEHYASVEEGFKYLGFLGFYGKRSEGLVVRTSLYSESDVVPDNRATFSYFPSEKEEGVAVDPDEPVLRIESEYDIPLKAEYTLTYL